MRSFQGRTIMYQRFSSMSYYRVAATIPMPVHSPQSAFPKWVSALLPCVCCRLTKTSLTSSLFYLFLNMMIWWWWWCAPSSHQNKPRFFFSFLFGGLCLFVNKMAIPIRQCQDHRLIDDPDDDDDDDKSVLWARWFTPATICVQTENVIVMVIIKVTMIIIKVTMIIMGFIVIMRPQW